MPVLSFRLGLTAAFTIWLLLGWPVTGPAQERPQTPEKITAPAASPEVLPRVLTEGAEALEKEMSSLKSRAAAASKAWSQAEKDSQERKAAMAALKASLAVTSLPLAQAEESLKNYSQMEERLEKRLKDLARETEALKKEQAAREASRAALHAEVTRLQGTRHPMARSKEMRQAQQRYQRAAAAAQEAAGQLLASLEKESRLLEKDKALLSGVTAELKPYVDAAWKAELLKRQEPVPLSEQAARMFRTLLELPARIAGRLGEMTTSGALVLVFEEHLAALIGLLALVVLLAWGIRRLAGLLIPLLASWETTAHTLGVQAGVSLVRVAAAHLFLLAAIFWTWLFLWSLGLWEVPAWRGLFYLLVALGGLRLGRDWLKKALAGKEAGGLLPVDADTARFYRKYLQLLLAYLFLGLWVLAQAEFLGFPPASRQFLGHLFRVGLLGGAMWLLRRRYLERLLPELPGPAWFKRPGVIRVLKGLVLLLLAAIILANLLGFQNLADYLAQAGAFTGVALLFLGLLWLALEAVLHYLLHPEIGWITRRYPHREETLQKLHSMTRGCVGALLAAAAILLALKAWGLEAARLAWAFQWLNWGPALGPVRLTPLTLGAAALVLYLGIWSSRLVRSLLEIRVYPRIGWDSGVQYTISPPCITPF